jgi:hypothetical protein
LDARADEAAFLVLEAEDRGEQALVPFNDRYWSPLDDQRDPKGRGVQIGSWKSDGSWLNQVKCQWQQLGHFSDNSYVVSFIRIQYRDILRVERELYFKVGKSSKYSRFDEDYVDASSSKCRISRTRELKGAILGRAETMEPRNAAMCMEAANSYLSRLGAIDPFARPTAKELSSLFEGYKRVHSSRMKETCA